MIYPKCILESIRRENLPVTLPVHLNASDLAPPEDSQLEQWIVSAGRSRSPDVASYLGYIEALKGRFRDIRKAMQYRNPQAKNACGDDGSAEGWAGEGMLPIAMYAHYLRSHGLTGDILECGAFKGGSTCCLSLVCEALDLRLWTADSFAGLPYEDHYYKKGEFYGCLQEVQDNVTTHGCLSRVTFIKGLFADSLKDFHAPLLILWIDADLKQSVLDVLENVYGNLVPGGVIFSDGLNPHRDFRGDRLHAGSGESEALVEFFAAKGIPHKAMWTGYGNLGLVVPNCTENQHLLYHVRKVKGLIQHCERDWLDRCVAEYDSLEQIIWSQERLLRERQQTISQLDRLCKEMQVYTRGTAGR